MTPERWQAVKAVFDQALEQPAQSRGQWIAAATGDDPAMRAEVESLIDALGDERDRFERPPVVSLDAIGELAVALSGIGQRVGPYRLVRQIGQGGMGVVFEAHRDDDQYRKRVAIKTISRGMNSDAILRRFRHERQILARLEHPNIAQLLDGGATSTGQPFFVLEYVDGSPIDEYCDAKGLPIHERLRLFAQVCGAVQYAHASLVVHRDLKPSNILVTADGTVKLLDFGIAKLLRDDSDDADGLTLTGQLPLTSGYASPEQVMGQAVTIATDVFSLGIVLYKLLAGRHPFAHDRPGGEEVRRRVLDDTPAPPSAAVTTTDAGERRRLQRQLRGELDNIVLYALRKEPARRYASVERLREDIARYLAGRPVAAQPDSASYRLRKFVRRNRVAVAAGTLGVVALVAGLGATSWQASVARRERDRARAAAATSERVTQFLQNVLGAADPSWYSGVERPGPQTAVGTIFDAAARRAETELASEPEVLAGVLLTLGRANQTLRRLDQAGPQLERARELHLKLAGPKSPAVAEDEYELAILARSTGDYGSAERWTRQAMDRLRTVGDSSSDLYGRIISELGLILAGSGRSAEAEPFIRESLVHRRRFDSASVANAILIGNLGMVLSQQGKLDAADPVYREALQEFRRFRPREYFEEGWSLGNLALDLIIRGRPEEALPFAREQVAHFTRLLGARHHNVGYGWVNVARALHAMGDETEALVAARVAESIFKGVPLPEGHPDFARTDYIQGRIFFAQGRLQEAESRLRSALAIRRSRLAAGSTNIADVELALGELLARTRRSAEAESLLVSALRIYQAVLAPADPRNRSTLDALVSLCRAEGRFTACAHADSAGRTDAGR